MHVDSDKVARAIGYIAAKLEIHSEPGKVLFGLACLLSFVLLIAIILFAMHDVIMMFVDGSGGKAMEAFMWGLFVFFLSTLLVVIREYLVGSINKYK
jgi:uncharacterized protein (UPF0261 family)